MRYVTTQDFDLEYTADEVISTGRPADGGLYMPRRFPEADWDAILSQPFGRCVAQVLNLLLDKNLTAWDVEFCIGRHSVRLKSLRQRILIGECWHNPQWSFDSTVEKLVRYLGGDPTITGNWTEIAVRMAILAGLAAALRQKGVLEPDVSCVSGSFAVPISVWYAKQWGMPLGNLICCCNENKNVWDLICHGQMRTDTISTQTLVPEADIPIPCHLERLICGCGGWEEALRYEDACREGSTYFAGEAMLSKLRKGLYVSVVSAQRLETTIPGAYATHGYLHAPGSALAYAGLLDYRAKTGNTGYALIFAERGPGFAPDAVVKAMNLTITELETYL